MPQAYLRIDSRDVMSVDYGRLRARAARLERERVPGDDPRWQVLADSVARSESRRAARAALVPPIAIPDELPIAAEAETIVELIRRQRVIVVAGETGSGKTTQLPKLCLAAGRGAAGMIGCTQPRRIAARSVARRVAQELRSEVGGLVGFQVRFTDQVGENALIKFMTDGILLAETQGDPWLSRYDTLIIDEAHERSLNIDFLLGYLKGLVARRRDLKLIVTSATIDTERFARHFGDAPVVNVEGRAFPVEVKWRPAEESEREERGGPPAIVAAVDEITRNDPLGDVLVFLPGEREIRDAHQALERRRYRETEVLPLYARLSARDQDRVFNPGPRRRIVLATNVAETSLTVPRIRYVIDPGLARVNRYSHRHKVQRLHVEPISQASADQRKGRCGRVGPGVCYRLYGADEFERRARYTEPELLRSSLAGVILRLMSLRLGVVESFAFLDPPAPRAVADGYQQLAELGAIEPRGNATLVGAALAATTESPVAARAAPTKAGREANESPWRLTDIGRTLAKLPIDVKLARMLLEASRLNCLRELTVIAAFLSIQDPRERPAAAREAADNAHRHYADPQSDFIGILNLWDDYHAAHEDLTQSKLRDWCGTRFLSYLRMREWRELHRQLLLQVQELGWQIANAEKGTEVIKAGSDEHSRLKSSALITSVPFSAHYEAIHRALLSGLPGQVAHLEQKGEYIGTRGRKYLVFPGSALAKKPPRWMLSATLLDTQRLYGLTNARVEPEWIEQQAAHLCKYSHYDPHWARSQGRVLGYERVSLFGLTLIERRRVAYEKIDPAGARSVFVREALLPNEIDCRAAFVARNFAVLEDARAEEDKRRRHGLVKDDEALYDWLEQRIPAEIANAVALDAWYKRLDLQQRRALEWTLEDVLEAPASAAADFPLALRVSGHDLPIEYRFDPNGESDGATLTVPLPYLNALSAARLSWLVPGLLREKVAELIRALPKALRKNFVPAPDFADAFVSAVGSEKDLRRLREGGDPVPSSRGASEALGSRLRGNDEPLSRALSGYFSRITGIDVAESEWRETDLPPYLRFNLRLLDEHGATLAESRDLEALQAEFGARARHQFAKAAAEQVARDGITRWDFEDLPETIVADTGLVAYAALVDRGDDVAIQVFERPDDAHAAHATGVARLLRLALREKLQSVRKQLPLNPKAALAYTVVASPDALKAEIADAALDDLSRTFSSSPRPAQRGEGQGEGALDRRSEVRDRATFEALVKHCTTALGPAAVERMTAVEETLSAYAQLLPKLKPPLLGFAKASYDDLREQLAGLVYKGFARELPLARMRALPRFLKAMSIRTDRLQQDPRKDQARMLLVREFADAYDELSRRERASPAALDALRWAIEEFRVQEFAQELGTREAVSEKRLRKLVQSL